MAWYEKPISPMRFDGGYVNMLNRYGAAQDSSSAWQFQSDGIIPDMYLTEQYEGNGLFAKIIDIPAEEAIKHGYNLGLTDTDAETYITDRLDYLNWEEKAATAIKWSRLYGGALGVMLIDDGGGIDEPINWRRIKGIEEIRVYDRACVWPDYSVMYQYDIPKPNRRGKAKSYAPRHGMPEYYYVNSIYGQFWVHTDRCLIFRNGILPERTMQPNYRFWGMPEYIRIKRELRETMTSHSTGVKMLERSVQAVYAMKELAALLAADDGLELVIKRLQTIDQGRYVHNSIAIDAEGESYDFKTIPMAGVKDVIDTTCNMLSAVTNIPQTLLFGRCPAGMNATGKSDLENWYSYIERIQKLNLRRNMQTLLDIIIHAGVNTGKLAEEPETKLTFSPLWSMSAEEEAKVGQTKAQTQREQMQTAKGYFEIGVLSPSEIRKGLAQEGEFCVEDLLENIGINAETPDLWGSEDDLPDLNPISENVQKLLKKDSAYDKIRGDDTDDQDWITVNGARIPVGGDGALQGEVGKRIVANGTDYNKLNDAVAGFIAQGILKKSIGTAVAPVPVEIAGMNNHAHKHGITREQAQEFVNNAVVMFDQGNRSLFVSREGNAVILDANRNLISAYGKEKFDLGIRAILEVLNNGH